MLRLKDSLISNNKSLKKSFVYEGRASREEFYLFIYFQFVFLIFNILLIALTKPLLDLLPPTIKNVILIILALPLVVYVLGLPFAFASLSVRRLHDLGMSGKKIYMLLFCSQKMGRKESNPWGESPRQA
jgi:uncharacterized membrane protein YhaH (DUF805 family)